MRRILATIVLIAAGCSTAPLADLMDAVAPGGSGNPGNPGNAREPAIYPPPRVGNPNDPPPLPPVPSDYTPDRAGERRSPPASIGTRPGD